MSRPKVSAVQVSVGSKMRQGPSFFGRKKIGACNESDHGFVSVSIGCRAMRRAEDSRGLRSCLEFLPLPDLQLGPAAPGPGCESAHAEPGHGLYRGGARRQGPETREIRRRSPDLL